MALGHLPSKIVASTDVNANDGLELMLFGGVQPGDQVVVTVYEQELFRHGELADLHVKAFSNFNGFNSAPVVISELQKPAELISDGSNGVLLTMKLTVSELTPPEAQRKRQKFGFEPPPDSDIISCQPKTLLAAVALGLRAVFNDMQFPPASVIRIPQNRYANNLLLFVVVSRPNTNQVIFSRPVKVSAIAPQGAHAPKIGGSGQNPGGPPSDTTLRPSGDVTGIYEAFTDGEQKVGVDIPALLIQLNQAGHAVAGWFTRPEESIASQEHLKIELPSLPEALEGVEHGVLLGQFDGQFRFNWGPTETTFIDPSFRKLQNKHTGVIEVVTPAILKLTFRRNGKQATLVLRQREPTPRWSNQVIDNLLSRSKSLGANLQLRETIRGYQVQPVPLAFWNQLGLDMTEKGVLGQLIIKERTTSPGADKRIARESISKYLDSLISSSPRHRDEIMAQFIAKAAGVEMQIDRELPPPVGDDKPGNKPLTVLDWLVRIQKEHLDNVDHEAKVNGNPLTVEQLLAKADRGFSAMGLVAKHAFVYRIRFHNVGAKLPIGGGFSAGAYAVALDITKHLLTADGGEKQVQDFANPGGEPPEAVVQRTGFFIDIGISLDTKFKPGGASGPVSEIEFRSVHNLKKNDFDGATFNVFSASLLSVANSAFTFFKGPSSMIVGLTVRRSRALPVHLIGGVDQWYSEPSVSSQPFKLHDAKPALTLVSVSGGKGWIAPRELELPPKPSKEEVEPDERLADVNVEVDSFFRVNSATLEGRSLAGAEEAMAVDRALFVSGGGFATAIGHASPEGSEAHNQFLSGQRADAINIAMANAFGKRLALTDIEVIGRSSRLAEEEGMLKPPVPPAQREKYEQQYRSAFKEYRFVLLNVNGLLLLRMAAGQGVGPADTQ